MNELLREGDVFQFRKTTAHPIGVYADVPKHFLYSNCKGDWDLYHGEISLDAEFAFLLDQRFIVVKVSNDGGGSQLGMNGHPDVFPDGHHVYCESVPDSHGKVFKLDFYQTGCFTCMVAPKDILFVGVAERTWKIKG